MQSQWGKKTLRYQGAGTLGAGLYMPIHYIYQDIHFKLVPVGEGTSLQACNVSKLPELVLLSYISLCKSNNAFSNI